MVCVFNDCIERAWFEMFELMVIGLGRPTLAWLGLQKDLLNERNLLLVN